MIETWFEKLKRLYLSGEINEAGLKRAVKFGWITEEEMKQIIASE